MKSVPITGIPEGRRAQKPLRLQLRISPEEKQLIREAARAEDLSVAGFALPAVLRRAREVLQQRPARPVEIKS